jgi:membrane protease YdiL (CAAX protease family)
MNYRNLRPWFIGPQGLRAGWGLLIFAVTWISLTSFFFALPIGERRITSELELFLAEGKLLASVFASTAVMAWLEGRSIRAYGLGGPHALQRLLRGAFWGVALLTLLIGWLFASGHIAIERVRLSGVSAAEYGLAYALAFLVAALAEELLFRGYLQVTLGRMVGFWPAAGALSLAFGIIHHGNPGESMLGVFNAALFGGVFCLCLRLSGSLWWGIGFHAAWDWAESFLWGTLVSGYVMRGCLLESHALGNQIWSGGAAGPEASALILPILCFVVAVAVYSFAPTERRPQVGSDRGRY